MDNKKNIRNFCIIAHIDHGKSTLADRLIENTGGLTKREMTSQILDNLDIEKQHGITIRSQAIRLVYKAKNNQKYIFNLIDTPGHIDFNYEVSRSLKACEGVILIVDATQGIQAQTITNTYLALNYNLSILPVINKIDLKTANISKVKKDIKNIIGIDTENIPLISAKMGINIEDVLEGIINNIECPVGDDNKPLKALIFGSVYDEYKGVIIFCRVFDGIIKPGIEILLMQTNLTFIVNSVGYFGVNKFIESNELSAGQIGYVTAFIKNIDNNIIGDTITYKKNMIDKPLVGYKKMVPMVYCGIYPSEGSKYEEIKDALLKLQLNDPSLFFEPESSLALGFGFRCGFLGLLHLEIVQERFEKEFNLNVLTTAPSVVYFVYTKTKGKLKIMNPCNMPNQSEILYFEEPIVSAEIVLLKDFIGPIMELCQNRRGEYKSIEYLNEDRAILKYDLPLNEIIYDFFDVLKSKSKGYASFSYEFKEYVKSDLVKVDILVNKEIVDALSFMLHRDNAYKKGKLMCEKLKNEIPRQLIDVSIQASVNGKIISRQTVKALRKDVLSKCYGGDITRKRKLLEKQKKGKKRMKQFGSIEISKKAFINVLKLDE